MFCRVSFERNKPASHEAILEFHKKNEAILEVPQNESSWKRKRDKCNSGPLTKVHHVKRFMIQEIEESLGYWGT